jgi:hypothetical protein
MRSPPAQMLSPAWQMTFVSAAAIPATAWPLSGSPCVSVSLRYKYVAMLAAAHENNSGIDACRDICRQLLGRIVYQLSALTVPHSNKCGLIKSVREGRKKNFFMTYVGARLGGIRQLDADVSGPGLTRLIINSHPQP